MKKARKIRKGDLVMTDNGLAIVAATSQSAIEADLIFSSGTAIELDTRTDRVELADEPTVTIAIAREHAILVGKHASELDEFVKQADRAKRLCLSRRK